MHGKGESIMGQKLWRILAGAFLVSLVLYGCISGKKSMGGTPVAEILYHGSDCGFRSDAPFGLWIGGASDFSRLEADGSLLCETVRQRLEDVDFNRGGVLLLGMGMQKTGGYGIRLASTDLEFSGDTAIVRLRLIRPSPGSRVTQALTWPCILIGIPHGEYRHVQAMDDAGRLMVKTRIH
ncbi:protease stability complex PrcB-like protein [Desulfobotulus alkaliphilus]|uniref:Protease stability complex PrcB-like protein n=1 Tax=Desulfobotulus alkaliphilus TaxID=622671 RepID=A0A562S228_9BACT|nr:protease complex subunit PrcB family protein [Desulfobotulus alkaliphilus]TWI75387.1 protease stability complex PrcB-like protein [Desulfobotulus alkaliphilus]